MPPTVRRECVNNIINVVINQYIILAYVFDNADLEIIEGILGIFVLMSPVKIQNQPISRIKGLRTSPFLVFREKWKINKIKTYLDDRG